VLSIQGRSEVRLAGMHSANGAPLAGPWAPVVIQAGGTLSPMSNPVDLPTPVPLPAAEVEASSSAGSDELDSLLASLEDSSGGGESTCSGLDADLEALLADL
jgi:hypothetical protein